MSLETDLWSIHASDPSAADPLLSWLDDVGLEIDRRVELTKENRKFERRTEFAGVYDFNVVMGSGWKVNGRLNCEALRDRDATTVSMEADLVDETGNIVEHLTKNVPIKSIDDRDSIPIGFFANPAAKYVWLKLEKTQIGKSYEGSISGLIQQGASGYGEIGKFALHRLK